MTMPKLIEAPPDIGNYVAHLVELELTEIYMSLSNSKVKRRNAFMPNWVRWLLRLTALNANDSAFAQLQLWGDRNQDGYASAEKRHGLAVLGIQSIDLNPIHLQTSTATNPVTGKTGIKGVVAIYADGSGVSGYGEILDLAKTCKTTRPMRFSQQKVLNIAQYCFVAIWLVQIPAAIGASFDCTKATTEIEKMICSNTELSKLDQVMAETYNAALLKSTEANALKNRQRQWLKDLRYCKTSNCLQGAYDARIRGLRDGEGAKTYDTPEFQSVREKDKATKVKAILAQYPMQIHDGVKEESRAFCNTFYEALRTTSPEIIYIEPVLRTDDPTHPALGEYLACDNYEPVSAYVYFVMRELGRRGFRLYRVDMDGHPENGLEEYLYGEDPPSQFNTFSAQVLRVDLQKCIVTDGVYASPENPVQSGNNGIYGFSALVQFQNQFYFYDLSRIGTEGDYYSINLSAYSPVKPGKRSVEIKEDIVIHYDGANIFGEFPAADICSWKVPHNQ